MELQQERNKIVESAEMPVTKKTETTGEGDHSHCLM